MGKPKTTETKPRDTCSRCGRTYELWYNQGGGHYLDDVVGGIFLFGDGEVLTDPVRKHFETYMFGSGRPPLCIDCVRREFGVST
jgi:hypothetical protein